ncbi:NAD(P)/FAD-dependent oxidoreductase [Peptococcaceae bacterium 1198_IL3148]
MSETISVDIAIIGCGPAGLAAAINAKIRGKSLALLGSGFCSPKLHKAPHIDNYLGFHSISGEELRQRFMEHVAAMGIEILNNRVTMVVPQHEGFVIQAKDKVFNAKAVILATGVSVARLLPGEQEKLGLGVSYCATCDGGLYKNRIVAVLGYSEEAIEEANYLSTLCERVIFFPLFKNKFEQNYHLKDNIEVIKDSKPLSIEGDMFVSGVKLDDNSLLEVAGVFVIRDAVLPDQLIPGIEIENGAIKVNRDLTTSIPGIYAAGDNTGLPHQINKAAGEGQVAALNAVKYIDSQKK